MSEELKWVIGAAISLLGLLGGYIARERQLLKLIKDGDDEISKRLTRVQAEYVRKEDLNGHIIRLEQSIDAMRNDFRETNRRIDSLLLVLSNFMGGDGGK